MSPQRLEEAKASRTDTLRRMSHSHNQHGIQKMHMIQPELAIGTMSGSGAIIVIDDSRDIVECLANLAEFYAHESCGQCTPCREGSLWMNKALHRLTHGGGRAEDPEYLKQIAHNIQGRTICAFGEACAWPVLSFVDKFKDKFEEKVSA